MLYFGVYGYGVFIFVEFEIGGRVENFEDFGFLSMRK